MSEIDSIFASKGKGKNVAPPPPSDAFVEKKTRRKSKKKKLSSSSLPGEVDAKSSSKKRPAPETVVDPSLAVSSKRQKISSDSPVKHKLSKSDQKESEQLADFKDSRGTGERRRTEEGWPVYKEHELGIGDEGGDTPLCPFDCECCF